jgi:hypothetical protein
LIRRTKKNLEAIAALKSDCTSGVFEVTQLVNSCLAVIVHVHESKITEKDDFSLPPDEHNRWPNLSPTKESVSMPLKWSEQMRLLRHGIAHGNIKFHPEESGKEITHVEIWNKHQKETTWGAKISIDQMREMIQFIDAKFGQDG